MSPSINTLLCPTDFSEPAQEAVNTAAQLARDFSARVILVHVVPPLPDGPAYGSYSVESYAREMTDHAHRSMERIMESIPEPLHGGIEVRLGTPHEQIIDVANEERVDLIVMATHGKNGWQRLFFGSVAQKVIRGAPVPVFVVVNPDGNAS